MSLSRVKTWIAGEVLTASDLNAEYNNILNNGVDLWSPASKNIDVDGHDIILDSDGDSVIRISTNNRFDVVLQAVTLFRFDGTASTLVNGLDFIGAATGAGPSILPQGSDTNAPINIKGKGTGRVALGQATSTDVQLVADQPIVDSSGNEFFKFVKTASAVNEVTVTNAATGNAPTLTSTGGDTDIGMAITPKGTGTVTISKFASSNVAITGGAVTNITDLAIADGGTAASTAANARTNLGLGTLATSSAVTQGLLSTSTANQSFSNGGGGGTTVALTGGSYAWWTASEGGQNLTLSTAGDPGLGSFSARAQDGSAQTVNVEQRYVTASPPYNDGPLFVYLTYEGSDVTGISVAPDPTWANHGPTSIRPERYCPETGKKYCHARTIDGVPVMQAIKDPKTLAAYLAGDLHIDYDEIEITLDFKDSDKKSAPHPFFRAPAEYNAVRTHVLLDGQSLLIQRLHDLYIAADDASVIHGIIKDGHIVVDNTPIADPTLPPTLLRCRAAFKLTR